jgi:branched-chain amino acid transport system ATP-binding protein
VVIALDLRFTHYPVFKALARVPEINRAEADVRHKAMDYLSIVGLESKAYNRADSLPYGLQRKLEIARALALKPSLLLLDEPAAGMNPEESMELAALIRQIKEKYQLTVLLIEHHMDVVMELCDRIVVMNFGEKLAEGTPEEIQSNPLVLKAYLGEGYKRA